MKFLLADFKFFIFIFSYNLCQFQVHRSHTPKAGGLSLDFIRSGIRHWAIVIFFSCTLAFCGKPCRREKSKEKQLLSDLCYCVLFFFLYQRVQTNLTTFVFNPEIRFGILYLVICLAAVTSDPTSPTELQAAADRFYGGRPWAIGVGDIVLCSILHRPNHGEWSSCSCIAPPTHTCPSVPSPHWSKSIGLCDIINPVCCVKLAL